jgi:hypothetical protein
MPPPDRIFVGCLRWLDLLQRNSASQAWALLSTDSKYQDLTQTQYFAARDWLRATGLLSGRGENESVVLGLRKLDRADLATALVTKALEIDSPAWLGDPDVLASDSADLPLDVLQLAGVVGLDEAHTVQAARRAQQKVDAELRRQIGSAGEHELIRVLEARWPGQTTHTAATDDTAGYDVAFRLGNTTWHLEVKATNRRGRLLVFVSRHEFATALTDPAWRLIVVGLGVSNEAVSLATLRGQTLRERAPLDTSTSTSWASAAYALTSADLLPGVCLDGSHAIVELEATHVTAWAPSAI